MLKQQTSCFSVFDHFVGLELKGLNILTGISVAFLALNLLNPSKVLFR